MPITVIPSSIPDVLIIEPKVFGDDRGWFFESFNERDFCSGIGESICFIQDNHSFSKKGVLRGLHYQMEQTQGKLVRVLDGEVFDVAVDLRKTSNTFGQHVGVVLSATNKRQLWIPPGFAHGFFVMSDVAEFLYKTTDYWHASSEQCIVWNDPALNIEWPDIGVPPILNDKDAKGSDWESALKFQ